MHSLARSSSARLAADFSTLVIGVVVGVVTARWLGPAGRGVLAALTLLSGLCVAIASMGLTDAAVVMVGQRRVSVLAALSANIGLVLLSGATAGAACFIVAALQIQPDSTSVWLAVAVASLTVPIAGLQNMISGGLMLTERIVQASGVIGAMAVVTLFATCILVIPLSMGIVGAALALMLGAIAGTVFAWRFLPLDPGLRPRWLPSYLGPALRYGVKLQGSQLLTLLAGRLDLLIVFSLLGEAAAGRYSISLTVASIVGLPLFALSYAIFPRVAYVPAEEARRLTLLVWRRGLIATLVVAGALAGFCPLGIPLLFGDEFSPAVTPALILLVGSVIGTGQWTLARPVGARGRPNLLVVSYGISLVTMVGLDFALIPMLGLPGAALASAASNLLGLIPCLVFYRQREGVALAALLPRFRDLTELIDGTIRTLSDLTPGGRKRHRDA